MSKPLGYSDRPANPKIMGRVKAARREVEWLVWAQGKYHAEFSVVSPGVGETKPVVRASGEGATVYRALFDAAAKCVDMGADRGAVLEGLGVALRITAGGDYDVKTVRGAALRLKHTHTRESKLKNMQPLA